MPLIVDTNIATVSLSDLGITLVHPTTNYDISAQFTSEEIRNSDSLTTAIQSGTLRWKKTSGGTIEVATNYDPDYYVLEQEQVEQGATANSSDAVLLDRANHTGTQLASTISDFAAQWGIEQARVEQSRVSSIAVVTNNTSGTLTNLTELQHSVIAGKKYLLQVFIAYRSAAGGTGIALTLSAPAGLITGRVDIPNGNDGTASQFNGNITSSGDVVVSTGVQTANTTFLAQITAIIVPTANGIVIPQFRTETNGTQVGVYAGSWSRISIA